MVLDDLTERFNVQLDSQLDTREAAVVESARVLADEHFFWYTMNLDFCFLSSNTENLYIIFN